MTDVDADRAARYIESPSAEAAAAAVEAAIERDRVVTLVGACESDGGGDGLPLGHRYVLVKPDGSIVVHGRTGAGPIRASAGEGGLTVAAEDGALEVAPPGDPSRGLVRFRRIDLLVGAAVEPTTGTAGESDDATTRDRSEGRPTTTGARERDGGGAHEAIGARLLAEPDVLEAGFRPLATERETPAGSVDLYGRDSEGRAVVVEIKAHRAGPGAVGQLDRYVAALQRDLHADAEVRGILVAPSATERTRRLLEERGYSFRAISADV